MTSKNLKLWPVNTKHCFNPPMTQKAHAFNGTFWITMLLTKLLLCKLCHYHNH